MTFDFTPGWLDPSTPQSGSETEAAPLRATSTNTAKAKAPAHPSSRELAELVRELFTEGSLTWDQLQSLSHVAELKPMLEPAIAGIPSVRRISGHRQ